MRTLPVTRSVVRLFCALHRLWFFGLVAIAISGVPVKGADLNAIPPKGAALLADKPSAKTKEGLPAEGEAAPVIIRTIELTNYYSCGLSNQIAMGGFKIGPNNLAEFPSGEGEYGGMIFSVRGMIQLGGVYPRQSTNIVVQGRVRALHLLHGTAGLTAEETEIARLVLHYDDGTEEQLPIVYGEHARDWWAWKKTEDPHVGPSTELAWHGSNRYAQSKNVELRVYRSTFENPKPAQTIRTIDYIRTGRTSCTPFLLGLTIQEAVEATTPSKPAGRR